MMFPCSWTKSRTSQTNKINYMLIHSYIWLHTTIYNYLQNSIFLSRIPSSSLLNNNLFWLFCNFWILQNKNYRFIDFSILKFCLTSDWEKYVLGFLDYVHLHACTYIYAYTHAYIYISVYIKSTYTYTYIHILHIHTFGSTHLLTFFSTFLQLLTCFYVFFLLNFVNFVSDFWICAFTYIYMYMCIYIDIYICTYTYTYIHICAYTWIHTFTHFHLPSFHIIPVWCSYGFPYDFHLISIKIPYDPHMHSIWFPHDFHMFSIWFP